MKLPNFDKAVVSEEKITGYLLNPLHADGAAKARFFAALGFRLEDWQPNMLKEHERVVLTTPLPDEGLEPGDVGTIVHLYADGKAYEVEFVALDGHTRAVVTVEASHVRPVTARDMTHARQMQTV